MTREELKSLSNLDFAAMILKERLVKIYNPETPLAVKLRASIIEIEHLSSVQKKRKKGATSE